MSSIRNSVTVKYFGASVCTTAMEEAEGVSETHDGGAALSRKEKRKGRKKVKRSERRQQVAEQARQEDEHSLLDPSFLEEALEKERLDHEFQLRLWLQREKEAQEEADRKRQEAAEAVVEDDDDSAWDYVEEGPAEIIWEGNEIIVRKQKVKVPKAHRKVEATEDDHPVSNPLLPESLYQSSVSKPLPSQNYAFEDHKKLSNNEHNPNFGTEQDKTHCPFHIKTGVCRFGVNCSRAHVYPDKSCTLLIRNMYNGPGLPLEHDEGLEYTDEEVLQNYEEFFEDVHGEFSKHGEIVNFKVCRNESSHLRGNVYVQFQSVDSALAAYGAFNGRFYAARQITCEFVVVTRWRAALCGEYMRSHHKVCSHGTACNFLHCFKNPRGLYDWADWDNPPPRSFSATGRRSRGDFKVDRANHKHHGRSDRRHREGLSSKSRRSHQCDDKRVSRETYGDCHSNDNSCEESLSVDRDHLQKEKRHRNSKKRYKVRHSSKSSSEESMFAERDGLREERRHRSSDKRSREEDGRTKRKEDARKHSRSQDRQERKRHGVLHDGSRTRGAVDKRRVLQRGYRSRSCESSKSDGGTSCERRQDPKEKRCDSHERYRPRSRSLTPDSLEQSLEDEVVLRRRKSRSSSDRRKRRHS